MSSWCERTVRRDIGTLSHSLCVRLEQDLVLELWAIIQLQVEEEASDALDLLTQILHSQVRNLGMNKHHEFPGAARQGQKAPSITWVHVCQGSSEIHSLLIA